MFRIIDETNQVYILQLRNTVCKRSSHGPAGKNKFNVNIKNTCQICFIHLTKTKTLVQRSSEVDFGDLLAFEVTHSAIQLFLQECISLGILCKTEFTL